MEKSKSRNENLSLKIAERIKTLLKEQNCSATKLFAETGLNKNALYTMSKGYAPQIEAITRIADYLDCSVDFLLGRTETSEDKFTQDFQGKPKVKKTQIKLKKVVNFCPQGKAAAGSPIFDNGTDCISVKVPKAYLNASIYTSVQVSGDSMEPELHDGDTVFAMKNTIPSNGHMALVHLKIDDPEDNGGYLIKIFRRISDTMVKLISLNSAYEPLYYNEAQIRSIEKVVYVFSPSK